MPSWRAPLQGADQAWMGAEGQAVPSAPGLLSLRALVLLRAGTRPAAEVLPTLRLGGGAVGAAQAATGGLRRAVLIIAARQEGLGGEMGVTGIRGDHGDATLTP
jgi:hypothetical protein